MVRFMFHYILQVIVQLLPLNKKLSSRNGDPHTIVWSLNLSLEIGDERMILHVLVVQKQYHPKASRLSKETDKPAQLQTIVSKKQKKHLPFHIDFDKNTFVYVKHGSIVHSRIK